MALQVEARHVGKVTVMKCAGRIVAGDESEHLHKEFSKLLPEHKHFVLHLGEVNFVDSSGWCAWRPRREPRAATSSCAT